MSSALNTGILHRVLLEGKDAKSFRLVQSLSLCREGCLCLWILRVLPSCRQDQDFGFLLHSFSPPCCLECVTESWPVCSLCIKWKESQVNTKIEFRFVLPIKRPVITGSALKLHYPVCSHETRVITEHLECGWCNGGIFNLNLNTLMCLVVSMLYKTDLGFYLS